jgi:uroporphyrinogen-III synthase
VVRPLVEIEVVEAGPVDLDGYDWLVLTSATGARELRRRARGRPARVAAIGRTTAEAWGEVDLVPAVSTQEGLLAEMPRPAGRVLFAGAEGARPLLADELAADVVVLYRTKPVPVEVEGDLAVVASPSAARPTPISPSSRSALRPRRSPGRPGCGWRPRRRRRMSTGWSPPSPRPSSLRPW